MGSYNGAEVCELVGFYLLNLLTDKFKEDKIGLCRDGSCSCFQNILGPDIEKNKKKIWKILRKWVKCNSRTLLTIFLGVTFYWNLNTYYPTENRTARYYIYINSQTIHYLLVVSKMIIQMVK